MCWFLFSLQAILTRTYNQNFNASFILWKIAVKNIFIWPFQNFVIWFGAYSYLLLSTAPTFAHIYKLLENGSVSVSQKTFLFGFSPGVRSTLSRHSFDTMCRPNKATALSNHYTLRNVSSVVMEQRYPRSMEKYSKTHSQWPSQTSPSHSQSQRRTQMGHLPWATTELSGDSPSLRWPQRQPWGLAQITTSRWF